MLHHVSDRSDWDSLRPFVIRKRTFSIFLDAIEKTGLKTVTFRDIEKKRNKRSIIISFDDCGKHLFDFAIPELKRREMTAVFYMPTAYIGDVNRWNTEKGQSEVELMDASDLKALEDMGMEVGGHSHNHLHLAQLSEKELRLEIERCSSILGSILAQPPVSFAYPFGSIPMQAGNAFEAHGFKHACAIFSPKQAASQLRRFIIHDGDSKLSMRIKLTRIYAWYRHVNDTRMDNASWT